MVDAIGGVRGLHPRSRSSAPPTASTSRPTRKIKGKEALNYVRERYVVGNGSDIGRMKRQQASIASMAHQVVTAGTLARPTTWSASSTRPPSLTVDRGLENVVKIAQLGIQFKDIGLDKIQFITIPNIPDPSGPGTGWSGSSRRPNRSGTRSHDEPLTKQLSEDVISAGTCPAPGRRRPRGGKGGVPGRQAGPRGRRAVHLGADPVSTERTGPEAPRSDWERRKRLAEVFGDALPDTTSDEREDGGAAAGEQRQTGGLREQVPPHHGS